MYSQAVNEREIGLAIKIKHCIKSVDKEIELAEREFLEIKSTDYDLPTIVSKQEKLAKCYGKKLCKLRKEIDHD